MARLGSGRFGATLFAAVVGASSVAAGEPPTAAPTATPAAPTATPAATPATEGAAPPPVRRDPKGKTGISPAMEAIVRGDAAFLARDFVGAAAAYQEAIKLDPQKPIAHLRMVALHLTQGELDQASVVLATAERFAGGDALANVQTLALKAMLHERRGALEDATLAWSAYALLGRAGGPALGDPLLQQAVVTTAAERKTVITATSERQAAYAKVRERIEKGLAEAEPSATAPLSPAPTTATTPTPK